MRTGPSSARSGAARRSARLGTGTAQADDGSEEPGGGSGREPELEPEEEERCRRYASARVALALLEVVVTVAGLGWITLSGQAATLLSSIRDHGLPEWLEHLAYLASLGILLRFAMLPLEFIAEYWLDCRFGLARGGVLPWLLEWGCRSFLLGAPVLVGLLLVVETLDFWPFLVLAWCAAYLLLRPVYFARFYDPVMDWFYPARFLRHETFVLPGVDRLTLPVYQVRVSHRTSRVNAGIRLRGRESVICVTDTLIDAFSDGEERVVMAHEFGHLHDRLHREERTPRGIAQARRKLGLGALQLLSCAGALTTVHFLSVPLGLRGETELAAVPLVGALTILLSRALVPLLHREARRDERDADEFALAVTGDVNAYLSVMRKLRRINLEPIEPSWLGRLLVETHPSFAEREELARSYRARHAPRRKARPWRGRRHIQRHGRR